MVKFYEVSDIFNFTWDQVAQGLWRRYPNPQSKHVLSEDVVCRHIDDNNLLHSKRLLTKTNRLPKWGERFVNVRAISVLEESIIDPVNKLIVTYTRNIGLANLMTVEEKCIYKPSKDNPRSSTTVERQVWISSNVFGLSRAIQAFGVERYKQNSVRANKGFQYILENLFCSFSQDSTTSSNHVLIDCEKLKEKANKAKQFAKSSHRSFVTA